MSTIAHDSQPARRILCGVCNDRQCVYTCPRCSTKTCSLPCSSAHKSRTGCSGVRNRAAYVPMNKYGYGVMMNDYAFLEDVGRKVGEWGKEIARGGYARTLSRGGATRGRARGRVVRGTTRSGAPTKRDVLKMQLDLRDIDVDLLPAGMARRKLNQSRWDFKNKIALLTIEFRFHRPVEYPSESQEPPFVLLTHKNDIETALLSIIQSHLKTRTRSRKDNAVPRWVKSLAFPHPDDPDSFSPPQCVMPAQVDPLSSIALQVKAGFYNMTPTEKLSRLLRGTQFVEFPTIDVWEQFSGAIVDTNGAITQPALDRKPKRRKLNKEASKMMMSSLVGGYGSDDTENGLAALSALAGYTGSDGEDEEEQRRESDECNSEDEMDEADLDMDEDEDEDEEQDELLNVDPAVLVKIMQEDAKLNADTEDDEVDWGSSGDEG